jgi:chromosome segregation ATPase
VVKTTGEIPGGAPTNLDRVRDIILGADFKAFDLKFQRQEEALQTSRDELRGEIGALRTAFEALERAQRRDADEREQRLATRLDALEAAVRDLRREAADSIASLEQGWEQSLTSLRDAVETKLDEARDEAREDAAALKAATAETLDTLARRTTALEDGASAAMAAHERVRDDLSARVNDVRTKLTEAVATLQQTKLSRYALGEVLLALGAQLLERADKRPQQPGASRGPAPSADPAKRRPKPDEPAPDHE